MSSQRSIVLLVGSPKGKGGTSGSIGDYVLSKISEAKLKKETFHVGKAVRKKEEWSRLVEAVDAADSVILSFPLYWDSMPSHLTKALECLGDKRTKGTPGKSQMLYLIVQNGFPEPWHNEIAVRMGRVFAREANFQWGGALNIGGGGAIAGRPLESTGGMTYKLRETLDMAASAMAEGKPIPEDVGSRLQKPLYPSSINTLFGGMMWRKQAKRKGVKTSLSSKPYKR